jgi:hypothetical protein
MGKNKKRGPLTEASRQEQEEELFDDLDSLLDEKAYRLLDRGDPLIAQTLIRMIDLYISSEKILSHMLRKYPHLWIQTQALLAAVRHLEAVRDRQ